MKKLWQRLVERYRRNQAELDPACIEASTGGDIKASSTTLSRKALQSLDNYTFQRVWILRCICGLGLPQGIGHSLLPMTKMGYCPIRLNLSGPTSKFPVTRAGIAPRRGTVVINN